MPQQDFLRSCIFQRAPSPRKTALVRIVTVEADDLLHRYVRQLSFSQERTGVLGCAPTFERSLPSKDPASRALLFSPARAPSVGRELEPGLPPPHRRRRR